jgi:sulfate adenylyltransferase
VDGGGARGDRGLIAGAERREQLLEQCVDLPSITLTPRQLADLELLLNGGFAPLTGFMTGVEYITVCCEMRLPTDRLWPMPVTLRVDEAVATHLHSPMLALRDPSGALLAVLHVEDVWQPDLLAEAAAVFGTVRDEHVGVATLAREPGTWYMGGRVEGLRLPEHHDFRDLRKTPAELRAMFEARGWERIVALHTSNPLHHVHLEMARRAARQLDAGVLIHGAVGPTMHDDVDIDPMTRVRCYRAALAREPFELAVLPLATRMAGPREALWHALIRKNFGCTHLIVGSDHAGAGIDANGEPFYEPLAARELVQRHAHEVGIEVVPFDELCWVPALAEYRARAETPGDMAAQTLTAAEMRRRLSSGQDLPSWFTPPEVEKILRDHYRPGGCTVFFTGLPAAGKSTVAGILASTLRERGLEVTLLDGHDARRPLLSEPSFVAAEITRHGGIVICASIAPRDETRKQVRRAVEEHGRFVLVHVATPGFVCEARDPKGLYKQARAGLLHLTGVSAPYEEPVDADLVVDTMVKTPEESADLVLDYLLEMGVVSPQTTGDVVIPAAVPESGARSRPITSRQGPIHRHVRSASGARKTGQ